LSGCFSSSSSSDGVASETIDGQAADGYLRGMFCYADTDDNGRFDNNVDIAASAFTGDEGEFSITGPVGVADYPVVCRAETGAVDMATNAPFAGQLSAVAGSAFVTPISTMVKAVGEDAVKSFFGTSLDTVSLDSDPTQNVALAQAAVTINAAVSAMSRLLYVQSGGTLENIDTVKANAVAKHVYAAFANQLQAKAEATSNFDLSADTDGLNTVLQATINEATQALTGDDSATNPDANDLGAAISATITSIISVYTADGVGVADLGSLQSTAETELNTQLDGFEISVDSNFTLVIADGIEDTSEVPETVEEAISGATSGTSGSTSETATQ
jgi:hypothetical protein